MSRRFTALLTLVALLAGLGLWAQIATGSDTITVTAAFPRTVGLYPGDEVRVVGVPIGTIREINVRGDHVEVVMELDKETPVAASTGAVVVPPGLLSSRYIQLTKPWLDGPRLANGATIDESLTAAPLELDDVTAQLDQVLEALGPNGVNADGTLSDLVDVSDRALRGNGQALRETLANLAGALDTISSSKGDIVTTIEQLQSFVTALAGSDEAMRSLEQDLASFTTDLATQRTQLRTTITNLNTVSRVVRQFVRDNGENLTVNIKLLRRLTTTLVDRQRELTELADLTGPAVESIVGAVNLETGTLDARLDLTPLLTNLDTTLCELLEGALLDQLCPGSVPQPDGSPR